jgi:predicted kinase
MIKLISLLNEIINKPKAIFLAGPAGSGKTTILKQLISLNEFTVINIDDTYEELLKKSNLGMNQKDFSPDELSQAAKLMGQASKITREKYSTLTQSLKNVIIDGTGAASKPLLKKKQELEDLGYQTFMIALYVSPITSLERNKNRDRSLLPSIVVRSWRDYNQNINLYKNEFGNNFILINNDPKDANTSYNEEEIKKLYFDTSLAKGKEKSPEEITKSKIEKEKINQDVKDLLDIEYEFDSFEEAKQKINNFI